MIKPALPLALVLGMAWSVAAPRWAAPARADDRPPARAPAHPNVLFLFTDDQRADTIHALGNPTIQTPNLDSLVRSGFVFRNAYCMGGDRPAVCLPSRTMLLSGRSLFHLKDRAADSPSFPVSMREAGYETYHHGKRGNSPHDIQARFEHDRYLGNDQKERMSGHPGQEIADSARKFLHERDKGRPFFMYLAFANPHDPRVVAEEDRRRYDEATLPLPTNYRPFHPFDNGELTIRDEALAPWPRTPAIVRKHLTDYYGVITHLDRQIGRILQALRDTGEYDRTIVVFSSDHGLALGSHGLLGKQNVYEDGMKVPLIVSGPGIPHGSSDAFAYLFDIYPTICDLVGAPVPPSLDGRSLGPVLKGQVSGVRDTVFLAYRTFQRSVRLGDWKLIRYPDVDTTQLFNLRDDPAETHNLAGEPQYADRLKELLALLERQQTAYGDTLPLIASNPRPGAVDEAFFARRKK